jgi:hypothetical protein
MIIAFVGSEEECIAALLHEIHFGGMQGASGIEVESVPVARVVLPDGEEAVMAFSLEKLDSQPPLVESFPVEASLKLLRPFTSDLSHWRGLLLEPGLLARETT